MTFYCCECGKPIHNIDDAFQRVTGFTRRRAQGGANTIYLRELGSEFMCQFCMDRRRRGLAAGQVGLL